MLKNKLSDTLSYMLKSEKNSADNLFYVNLMLSMPTVELNTPIVAGVGKDKKSGKIVHYVGKTYDDIKELSDKADVLRHECLHIMLDHFGRFEFKEGAERENWATDLAINEMLGLKDEIATLSGEPIKPITVNNLAKQFKLNLPRMATAETYLELLRKLPEQPKGSGSGKDGMPKTLDEHMGSLGETDKDALREKVQKAVQAAKRMGAGNFSGNLETLLQNILNPKVDWKYYFRRFIANSIEVIEERTRKRPNRRYGFIQPGIKKHSKLHIGVPVDTSGSMSDEALAQSWAEIHHMAKSQDIEVTVIESDCEVKNVYKFDPKKKPSFSGRGGTAYQPAIDKALELGVDAIIYIGDMDAADVPNNPKIPFLWAVFGESSPPGNFGSVVRIE